MMEIGFENIEEKRRNIKSLGVAVISLQSFTFAVGMATFILLSQTHEEKPIDVTLSSNKSHHSNQEHQDDNNPPLIGEQIWIPFLIIITSRVYNLPRGATLTINKVRNCLMVSVFTSLVCFCFLIVETFFLVVYFGKHYIPYKLLTSVICLCSFITLVCSIITSSATSSMLPEFKCCSGNISNDFIHFVAVNRISTMNSSFPSRHRSTVTTVTDDDPPPPYPGPPPPKYEIEVV